ncbi:MAG: tripartite tricarboxylate transporter substrate binding protein [Alphaproteobacteria bacterium]|nr:tripartite tricarboxylate transporter substrate binding protein [Alphaproteobacteria bacterium]
MLTRRKFVAASAAALAAGTAARAQSGAEGWPSRPVRLIVPFPPGGGTDAVGRILSARLAEIWGQQMVIENRGGAGSNIGAEAAARSTPDGYTMFFAAFPLATNKFIYPTLSYDPIGDFAPITLIGTFPNVLVVPNTSPAKSVKELIAHAKADRGNITFGSAGIGTSPHLNGELFIRMAGIEATHIPYRGAGPSIVDLIPGRLTFMFNTSGALLPHVKAGRMRALAVSSAKRFSAAPELPTVAESGVPGFDVVSWYALFAPVKTPPAIVAKMHKDAAAVIREPAIRQRLEGLGLEVVASTPQELATFLRNEMTKWEPIIKAAKIVAQ